MFPLPGVEIREMRAADIPAGLGLVSAAGWNQTERDWECFLLADPRGAHVATENGRVIGTIATMPYGPFTWLAMVLVAPSERGRGVGTSLLHHGLARIERATARLDATPAGEVLYRQLGFEGEYGLARLVLDRRPLPAGRARHVRPFDIRDWPAVLDVDARVFGAPRSVLLERLFAEAGDLAWVDEAGGRLRGYVFGRHGRVRDHLGPLVAESVEAAVGLLDAWLSGGEARGVYLDAPDAHAEWRAALAARGFAIERTFLRMHRARLTAPGQPSLTYAITGPEFG